MARGMLVRGNGSRGFFCQPWAIGGGGIFDLAATRWLISYFLQRKVAAQDAVAHRWINPERALVCARRCRCDAFGGGGAWHSRLVLLNQGRMGGNRAPPPEPGLALAQGRARAGLINRRGSRIYSSTHLGLYSC